MNKILAIGGAVIKTARDELIETVKSGKVEILIHNGGSLFHDFQLAIDPPSDGSHSYPIDYLMEKENRISLNKTNNWIQFFYNYSDAPRESITFMCNSFEIPVLVFTALGCDWWNFSMTMKWDRIALRQKVCFEYLRDRFKRDRFHYICMGSAVIHPEIFIKALAFSEVHKEPNWFKADVVDFLDMYRPMTRVAKYGAYYKMTHKEFLTKLNNGEIE